MSKPKAAAKKARHFFPTILTDGTLPMHDRQGCHPSLATAWQMAWRRLRGRFLAESAKVPFLPPLLGAKA
jgi:hypothetical protein